jgi:hypothetical protein
MRAIFSVFLALLLSGCVVFLEHPDVETVQGLVVRHDNGKPVPNAEVVIWEGRRFFTLLPISYPSAARATADANGVFSINVANSWPAQITAHGGCLTGSVTPDHTGIRAVVIRLTEGKNCFPAAVPK